MSPSIPELIVQQPQHYRRLAFVKAKRPDSHGASDPNLVPLNDPVMVSPCIHEGPWILLMHVVTVYTRWKRRGCVSSHDLPPFCRLRRSGSHLAVAASPHQDTTRLPCTHPVSWERNGAFISQLMTRRPKTGASEESQGRAARRQLPLPGSSPSAWLAMTTFPWPGDHPAVLVPVTGTLGTPAS